MSRFLLEPKTSKRSFSGKGKGLVYGQSCMQGWRETMEDAHVTVVPLPNYSDIAAFGIFDGHGGDFIAQEVERSLLGHVTKDVAFQNGSSESKIAEAMCKGFLAMDKEMQGSALGAKAEEVGSTGLLVMVTNSHIIVGNVGDTRCMLSQRSGASALSVDHKPTLEVERQRVLAAGGTVFRNRVCGGVAVSRSFGDFWFKRNGDFPAHEQQVTAEPYIHIHKRNAGQDEFLVLACDGIFDVLSNEQVRQFVVDQLKIGVKCAHTICELMMEDCLKRGSRDNMSVTLVLFDGAKKYMKRKSCTIQ